MTFTTPPHAHESRREKKSWLWKKRGVSQSSPSPRQVAGRPLNQIKWSLLHSTIHKPGNGQVPLAHWICRNNHCHGDETNVATRATAQQYCWNMVFSTSVRDGWNDGFKMSNGIFAEVGGKPMRDRAAACRFSFCSNVTSGTTQVTRSIYWCSSERGSCMMASRWLMTFTESDFVKIVSRKSTSLNTCKFVPRCNINQMSAFTMVGKYF